MALPFFTVNCGIMKLGTFLDVPDVMNRVNFHLRVRSILRAGEGQKECFAFEMPMALSTMPCASALASDDEYYFHG
jgi:hypothetical protein